MRVVLAGLATLLAACYHPSPAVGVPCSATGECPSGQSCDLTQTPPTCVGALIDAALAIDAPPACIVSGDCTGATAPICDPSSHTCRGCAADVECQGVCTEYSGECFGNGQAIFVSPTGTDGGQCNGSSPCRTFSFAFQQITANRRIIRVGDGMYMSSGSPVLTVGITGGRVVFSGEDSDPDGAFFTAVPGGTTNPQTVQVNGGTDVVIEGITIRNGSNDGLRNQGALLLYRMAIRDGQQRGIEHQPNNGAAMHVWESVIEGNQGEGVYSNDGTIEMLRSIVRGNGNGGMQVQKGAVTITNSMFTRNGMNGGYGGIRISQPMGQVAISFVTIAFNMAGASNVPGINSDSGIAIESSIVTDNVNGVAPSPQICAGCTATYSLFSGTPPIGEGNIPGPAGFVDEANNDFHLMASSPAVNAANPGATVLIDLDGNVRPYGSGYDIGADEYGP